MERTQSSEMILDTGFLILDKVNQAARIGYLIQYQVFGLIQLPLDSPSKVPYKFPSKSNKSDGHRRLMEEICPSRLKDQ